MNQSNLRRILPTMLAVVATLLGFIGCSDLDNGFGSNLKPNSQELELFTLMDNTNFETRVIKSDSISASNIGMGLMGAERHASFGERRAGFYTQFVPMFGLEDEKFGFQPIFDSMMLYMSVVAYSGDTTMRQTFDVYEVTNLDFMEGRTDSVFYTDFDVANLGLGAEPLFTFTFPDQERGVYTTSKFVRMFVKDPNAPATKNFIEGLMLEDEDADETIYDPALRDDFIKKFKGLYIKPTSTIGQPTSDLKSNGGVYTLNLEASGIGFYGRSMYESDPEIVADTVGMNYIFEDTYSEYYGLSINTIDHSHTADMDFGELNPTIRVEGMCGAATEITLTKPFFDTLYEKLQTETDNLGGLYKTLYVNQARLDLFLTQEAGGNYDPMQLIPLEITPWLNSMPSRLGLYKNLKNYLDSEKGEWTLEGISDYDYMYESMMGIALNYGGYLNRSLGCYEMNIESHIQNTWNNYLEAVDAAGGDPSAVNWGDVEGKTFYLAPSSSNLYTTSYVSLQGMENVMNNAPIRLRVSYTLIK